MAYPLKDLDEKIKATQEWLSEEYFSIRTGRATPALLDSVQIEAYGSRMPLNQVANITVEDARTLRVVPYDIEQAKEIERMIGASDLGVSVGADEKGIRIFFPELTSERREQLLKLIKAKMEEARVSLRKLREEIWEDIQNKEKEKEISEDDKFRAKDEMQKAVDEGNRSLEAIAQKKEHEISN